MYAAAALHPAATCPEQSRKGPAELHVDCCFSSPKQTQAPEQQSGVTMWTASMPPQRLKPHTVRKAHPVCIHPYPFHSIAHCTSYARKCTRQGAAAESAPLPEPEPGVPLGESPPPFPQLLPFHEFRWGRAQHHVARGQRRQQPTRRAPRRHTTRGRVAPTARLAAGCATS